MVLAAWTAASLTCGRIQALMGSHFKEQNLTEDDWQTGVGNPSDLENCLW